MNKTNKEFRYNYKRGIKSIKGLQENDAVYSEFVELPAVKDSGNNICRIYIEDVFEAAFIDTLSESSTTISIKELNAFFFSIRKIFHSFSTVDFIDTEVIEIYDTLYDIRITILMALDEIKENVKKLKNKDLKEHIEEYFPFFKKLIINPIEDTLTELDIKFT